MVNAFWLDRDAERAAPWLVDAHVTSSVFECSMVPTTALHLHGLTADEFAVTHEDHPLTQWAARSHANWRRLREYTAAAHREWRYRWDHGPDERHGSWATVAAIPDDAVADAGRKTQSESSREPTERRRVAVGQSAADSVTLPYW